MIRSLWSIPFTRLFLSKRRISVVISFCLVLCFLVYSVFFAAQKGSVYYLISHFHRNIKPIIDNSLPDKAFQLSNCKYCETSFYENSPIPSLKVTMQHSDFIEMMNERKIGLNEAILHNGQWLESSRTFHKAEIKLDTLSKKDCKIKLIGMNPDQFGASSFFSFRIKMSGENRVFNRKTFNVLVPYSRTFTRDFLANIVYQDVFEGLKIHYRPVKIYINKSYQGIYFIEDFFDKFLMENNQYREGVIFESAYGNESDIDLVAPQTLNYGDTLQLNVKNTSNYFFDLFKNKKSEELFPLIDYEKMLGFISIGAINASIHQAVYINNHWYYNPVTNKIEPTIRELSSNMGRKETDKNILSLVLSDRLSYYKLYVNKLPSIFGEYIQFISKTKNIYQDMDSMVYKALQSYQKHLQSEEYLNFVKQLGIRNARYVTRVEKNLEVVLNAFSDSFKKYPLDNKYSTLNKTVHFKHSIDIKETKIIAANEILEIDKGVTVSFSNNAKLLIYGQIKAIGTEKQPIRFISDKESKSSIFIHSTDTMGTNIFQHSIFKGLSNLKEGIWNTPSTITVYKSKIAFEYCLFRENRIGDDFINLFRVKNFSIKNCTFINTVADAIDLDFSSGIIKNCTFSDIGNDAIDGSGSEIDVVDCNVLCTGDKAISSGEKSIFRVKNSIVSDCAIGLVSKDQSVLEVDQLILMNNKMDICVFQKKPEFGAAKLIIDSWQKEYKYLIQKESTILTKYQKPIETLFFVKDVESKLYGNEYGKASK